MQDSQVSGDGLAVDGGGQPTAQRRFASLEAWLAESMVHGAATPEVEVDKAEYDVEEAAVIAAEAESDADEAVMPTAYWHHCRLSPSKPQPVLIGYKSYTSPKVAAAAPPPAGNVSGNVSAKPAATVAAKRMVAGRTPLGEIGNLPKT